MSKIVARFSGKTKGAHMKIAILAASIILAGFSTAASAEGRECWNPRAGHYEEDRPGERQNDLDYSRCRSMGWRDRYVAASPAECWNPRAGHFESVRSGEVQNDLDFSRCRSAGYDGRRWRDEAPRECWNPRAGHYEEVRLGEVQNDLDFSRCRR
jgi:hypothetical protein